MSELMPGPAAGHQLPQQLRETTMPYLVAAVGFVGALCLLDLLLTFGVIRRLRAVSVSQSQDHGLDVSVSTLEPGQSAEPFTARTTTPGTTVSGPAGLRLIAFFSTHCSICPKRAPSFVSYVRANGLRAQDVLAIVTSVDGDLSGATYLDDVAAVARVSTEEPEGPVATAFQVTGFPAFCLLEPDGTVRQTTYDPADLPVLAAA
jgi:hypothetical protein